ncbi:penicillin-binding protein 2 [Sandarakinorhabdus limnophila]|uniref:penicillin-binding protein 2 n=1 Tax=Sandarakinorhabdus limnophila TaxID=210512 RepID=UPI0026EA5150|nr:penicillin-binding protein 2 [Sandarakinorhabdus limnophila]MCM0033955.1 penicillin-binding protein 2 [Sandarakinorhabdus limnophila]
MDDPVRRMAFSRRALLLGAGMAGTGALLAGRMAWLAVFEGETYQLRAQANRIQDRLIPPRRGWIVDRQGKPIAMNRPDYRLELRPAEVEDVDTTLVAIRAVLDIDLAEDARIRDDVRTQPSFMPVVVRQNLSWREFSACNVRLATLPGVTPVQSFSRFYPEADHFAHLVGYVGAPTPEQYREQKNPLLIYPGFRIGKDGIERFADKQLRGTAGSSRVEMTARGELVRELGTNADTPGDTLRLTIDRDLQDYAARRLGDNSASVIVMDCITGDVLCMVSMPAYDPNIFSRRVPARLWNALQKDDHTPLLNKSAMGLYPPGSTFKMVTTLAALEAGVDPGDTVGCSGAYRLGNNTWHCHARRGHGGVNMHRALPLSCDTYFYVMGRKVGIDAIATMARRLGLGQEYPLPLPGQAKGIVPDKAWKQRRFGKDWREGETLNGAIGQGYIVTNPLQLAVMTARLASGREVMPRLIADGPAPQFPSLGIPDAHLALVRQGMVDVVNAGYGTARAARSPIGDVLFAGKTGTAQVRRISAAERKRGVIRNEALPWKQRDHALFVAFAPADAPRYACSVIIEHGIAGGRYAAPIARDVLSFLFEPQRALAVLPPIEAEAARLRAVRQQNEAAASIASETRQMMPSWLKLDIKPPVFEIADADAPQPPREPE